uniref:Large ribosomal subunit protein mL52 n=1 Tax=Pseudonaja textilis TaxID=8673 RepID=A0A670YY43_PSETE
DAPQNITYTISRGGLRSLFDLLAICLISERAAQAILSSFYRHGLPENPSDQGLTTDLPDWSFADGRPAPPMAGHLRRQEKKRELVRRIAQLSSELDHGMKKWEAKQKKQEEDQEEKRRKRLRPKGDSLQQVQK